MTQSQSKSLFLTPTREAGESSLHEKMQVLGNICKPGLQTIETRIRSVFKAEAGILTEISSYLLDLGGKRVRPILALLSERLFKIQVPSQRLVDAAAGIELIHMATLLHDDIIDKSTKRRNKDSAFIKYGFTPSLLAGDFLWVRAFGLCAHLGEFIVNKTEKACIELTEGEVMERKLDPDILSNLSHLEEYYTVVSKKTASLFALACAIGAHCANRPTDEIQAVEKYGRAAGICFQMVDDILDVVAPEDLLGKPTGTDLRQRTPSLINILWLESGDSIAKDFFSKSAPSEDEVAQAVSHLRKSSIIEQARKIAELEARQGRQCLESLPSSSIDTDVRDLLIALLEFTLNRSF